LVRFLLAITDARGVYSSRVWSDAFAARGKKIDVNTGVVTERRTAYCDR
jgi:hypothetical protein